MPCSRSCAAASGSVVRTSLGLRDDRVDDAELEAVGGVRLERRRRLPRLARVAPQDRGAALRRDDRVDRVLLHQHAIGDGDRDRAARSALADDARDGRDVQPHHRRLRARDRAALAVLLGRDARIRTGRVDHRDERKAVPVGERHRAHRLAIALGIRHPEVPLRALLDVAALLVADEHDGPPAELPEPGHERGVVGATAVAVELEEVVEDPLDVVERVRPVEMTRELDRLPDLLGGRIRPQLVELILQPRELAA